MANKMTLEEARATYRANSRGDSNKALACKKIAISLKSARTKEEAIVYIQADINNCRDSERLGYYHGAIEALS